MNIIMSIGRWLSAVIISVALSLWMVLLTINTTVANRDVTKSWLASSGIYSSALPSLLRIEDSSASSTDANITTADMQTALLQAFDSKYLQSSTNTVIDAIYDWLEGKTATIAFNIPVQERAGVFSERLAEIVEIKLAALPQCTGRATYPSCLPAGVSAEDYSRQITKLSSSASFLNTPLTQSSFGNSSAYSWLPGAFQFMKVLLIALPVVILVFGGLFVLLSKDKIFGLLKVGRQIAVSAIIFLVFGVALWIGSGYIDLSLGQISQSAQQAALATAFVNPLVKTVLNGLGIALSIVGAITAAIGAAIWVGAHFWMRKRGESGPSDALYEKPTTASPAPAAPKTQKQQMPPKPPRPIVQ